MTTNWDDARKKISVFKRYMKNAPKSAPQKKGYLITREELEKLLKKDQGKLDGIRIYFGGEIVEDFMVPTLVIVGCEKGDDGKYHDYEVPDSIKTLRETQKVSLTAGVVPTAMNGKTQRVAMVAGLQPCPTVCGKKNILNV